MRNITQFLLMLTLSFYIAFAPAVAYADEVTDKIDKLKIDLQKRVGDRWTLSPRNKSVGAGVEIGVSQSYPVTATTTATTAAGATRTSTATLTAEKIGSKIFTPTTANIAKRFAGGVATTMVAMALYDLLGKAVDYVLDPANNTVQWKEKDATGNYKVAGGSPYYASSPLDACHKYAGNSAICTNIAESDGGTVTGCYAYSGQSPTCTVFANRVGGAVYSGSKTLDELAQRSQDIANNPNHKDNATAQAGMQTVVNDMITKNEIDNSYFNDADISNDTYNDVTNNYVTNNITNQYPSVSVPSQSEMAQAAANGQSSVTKTTQNSNGSTTTTTTNFSTTNNTTTNNNTYNITNITVNNPVAQKDDSPASTPASTTTPTASTTTPTDSKPFELPAFCDWAKPVCDFVDWVKKDPTDNAAEPVDVQDVKDPPFDLDTLALKPYISLPAECPANPAWNFMGGQIVLPLNIVCDGFSMASWLVMAFAWLRGLVIVGSTFKG